MSVAAGILCRRVEFADDDVAMVRIERNEFDIRLRRCAIVEVSLVVDWGGCIQ